MRYRKNTWAKKFLTALVIAVVLVALFLISFTVTSMILKSNQAPEIAETEEASPTPKPTYEELEKMVIEKDERIKELESLLGMGAVPELEPQTPIAPNSAPEPTAAPAPKPTKTSAPTLPAPTIAPLPNPTVAPANEQTDVATPLTTEQSTQSAN
ncbi:MAG: hypothetical protein IKB60_01575 [Clostridia bacterium]|nr:hypothetical protein [Clostridia bacterium]